MIRLTRNKQHTLYAPFIYVLFSFFTIISFFVIIIGAEQFHLIASELTDNYKKHIISSYLTEKINQHDVTDSISICDLNGIPALELTQIMNGEKNSTYIYTYDGYLRELTTYDLVQASPKLGKKIAKADTLQIDSYSNHLYCITITYTNRISDSFYISCNAR